MLFLSRLFLILIASAAALPAQKIRIGLIGLDTSHVIAFTSLLNEENNPLHVPGAIVTAAYKLSLIHI